MTRRALKRTLRRILAETLAVDEPTEMHRCVSGKMVPIASARCVKDLEYRIQDAVEDRNACVTRTDARVHYNGLLNVLRRKLRRSRKLQPDI